MPTYNYTCTRCGTFTARSSIADFDQPTPCPMCGSLAARTFCVPDSLLDKVSSTRPAETAQQGSYQRLHAAGRCSCC